MITFRNNEEMVKDGPLTKILQQHYLIAVKDRSEKLKIKIKESVEYKEYIVLKQQLGEMPFI